MKNIEEILRELCYKAWHFARNAHRLYPDNKHTFSDYSSTEMKKDIDAATKAMEEYLQENTKWISVKEKPQQGRKVLLYWDGLKGMQTGSYTKGVWRNEMKVPFWAEPSHWMPLPPPPKI